MQNKYFLSSLVLVISFSTIAGVLNPVKVDTEIKERSAYMHSGNSVIAYVHDPYIYNERWDTLPQTLFWRQVIDLTQDSCVLNVASTRQVLGKMDFKKWLGQSEDQKKVYKDSLRAHYCLPLDASIFVTSGKKEFYNYRKEIPSISKAVKIFSEQGVNPWFAQVILLIESPGKLQKSNVGAYGSFQLMKSVAKRFGLIVNDKIDERADFDKSAVAASKLIGLICIPEIKKILDDRFIEYNESELWFRLLVLHAYHAGSGNVAAVINKINPSSGGMSLITQMWQTEAAGFRNASQNYSQIGIASLIRFSKMIEMDADCIFISSGDRSFHDYIAGDYASDNLKHLSESMNKYAEDLIHGLIPVEYFLLKTKVLEQEILTICSVNSFNEQVAIEKASCYSFDENKIDLLGKALMKERRYSDAVRLLKQNVMNNPSSVQAHTSLASAYQLSGKKDNAANHNKKVAELLALNEK